MLLIIDQVPRLDQTRAPPTGEQNRPVPGPPADGVQPHGVPLPDRVGDAAQGRPGGAEEEGHGKDRLREPVPSHLLHARASLFSLRSEV